jgi:hypothetical protein
LGILEGRTGDPIRNESDLDYDEGKDRLEGRQSWATGEARRSLTSEN